MSINGNTLGDAIKAAIDAAVAAHPSSHDPAQRVAVMRAMGTAIATEINRHGVTVSHESSDYNVGRIVFTGDGVTVTYDAPTNSATVALSGGGGGGGGSSGGRATVVTGDTTATNSAKLVVDASSSDVTVTLPSASTADGPVRVKKVDSTTHTVVVVTADGALVEGESSLTLAVQGDGEELWSDGTNWWRF